MGQPVESSLGEAIVSTYLWWWTRDTLNTWCGISALCMRSWNASTRAAQTFSAQALSGVLNFCKNLTSINE